MLAPGTRVVSEPVGATRRPLTDRKIALRCWVIFLEEEREYKHYGGQEGEDPERVEVSHRVGLSVDLALDNSDGSVARIG